MARLNINTIDLDSFDEQPQQINLIKIKPKTKMVDNDNSKLKLSYKEKQQRHNNIDVMEKFSF